ncbi:MAG: hypothetical protein IMZ52_03885 [Actinobacteria bacterium]|nr:hypothetical protein [Actinomycetota bacterium]
MFGRSFVKLATMDVAASKIPLSESMEIIVVSRNITINTTSILKPTLLCLCFLLNLDIVKDNTIF